MFTHDGNQIDISLIDFGLSKILEKDQQTMRTRIGTPYYVCPEIIRGTYTKQCDMWSVGVLAYILLCGYPPFHGESEADLFDRILEGKFEFKEEDWEGVSQLAKDFIVELL